MVELAVKETIDDGLASARAGPARSDPHGGGIGRAACNPSRVTQRRPPDGARRDAIIAEQDATLGVVLLPGQNAEKAP